MKEVPNGIIIEPVRDEVLHSPEIQSGKAAIFPLDEDEKTYLVANEKKNRKLWRTYQYDIVSFVPSDPITGGDDQYVIEKDVSLPADLLGAARIHSNANNAVFHAAESIKMRNARLEKKAERISEAQKIGKVKAFWRWMNSPMES